MLPYITNAPAMRTPLTVSKSPEDLREKDTYLKLPLRLCLIPFSALRTTCIINHRAYGFSL